ncbi:MAG TPA: hypothetical protein PKY59_09040 [Pyrinomonadaceae bacterium]|nr:hypothetical protein [Pyrinomonadaceae bacterium]
MFSKEIDLNKESILGKKNRTRILRDNENRFIMLVVGNVVWIGGLLFLIVSVGSNFEKKYGFLVLIVSFVLASILLLLGLRCPFCDSLKWNDYFESKYIKIDKWTFKCHSCNLTNKQIAEIIDMLGRNIEVTPETIARFNRREI